MAPLWRPAASAARIVDLSLILHAIAVANDSTTEGAEYHCLHVFVAAARFAEFVVGD